MKNLVLRLFNPIAVLLAVSVSLCSSVRDHQDSHSTRLRPIHIFDYQAAIGLHERRSEFFSSLDLESQSEMIYGSPGDNGQLLFANMTLYAPDGLLMVMMERFEGLTSSVDCKGDDRTMSLTFKSENAFNYALKQWQFINENDDGKFLLIANHDGCGRNDQRQPYLISKITEDTTKLTTHLAAQIAPWSDVAGTYDLDFGQAVPYQKPKELSQRGLWGDITNVGKDVLNAAEGNADLSKSITFDMSVGHQGQKTNIYTDDEGRLTLDCINCFVTGSFEVTGHLSVHNFYLQDLKLTTSPNDFQAELELEATIISSESPDSLQYTKELFSFPVPDAGIEVEGIFKLGAILSYDVGVSSSFSGSATVDFGLQASIPNSAQLIADVQNPDQSSANGFDIADVTPIFDITKESASITLAAFSQPKLSFGIELIEVGNIDVAITVKLPEVSVTLSAEYDEAGTCSQNAGSSKTGVKLDSKVDVEVDLQIDASLGDDEDTAKPSWSKKLWGVSEPLGSMCFPLGIPGLQGKVNSTSATGLPASTTGSSGSSTSGGSLSGAATQTSVVAPFSLTTVPTTRPIASTSSLNVILSSFSTSSTATVNATPSSGSIASSLSASLTSSDYQPTPSSSLSTSISYSTSSSTTSPPTVTPSTSSTPVDAVGNKKAAVVHPSSSAHASSSRLTSSVTSKASTKTTSSSKAEAPSITSRHLTSSTQTEELSPSPTKKPSHTSSTSSSTAEAKTTSSAESGGGGCKMVRRFGKRMLIC